MATVSAIYPGAQAKAAGLQVNEDATEFYHYEDTGCEASESCLNCPLPMCRYDDPAWYQRNRRIARDFRVLQTMERESLTVEQAADRFGITVRTVFRILQRCREARQQAGQDAASLLAA